MKNPITTLFHYFRESKEELTKVTWPTRQATVRYSVLVICMSVIMAAFFAGLDWALSLGIEKLIGLSS